MDDVPFRDLIPVRAVPSEEHGGRVTLRVPRFTSAFARRWLTPLLPRPDVRVHLDELGSAVWRAMDDRASIAALAARVHSQLGGGNALNLDRVSTFLRRLHRADAVTFLAPATPSGASSTEDR
jgi:hypothetical protein